ncbi:MAG: hypothetical protein JWM98_3010 [Thermoleophilia bacterium]|nr:hypothetical protein [Thermoleophilia bacterium]
MLTPTRQARRAEGAFTLIELVVAMILLVIVFAGVVYAVVGLGRGNSDAMTNRKAQRQALDAMEVMRHDIAAARSPAMDQWDSRREDLRELIYFRTDQGGTSLSRTSCGGLAYVKCIQDITKATPTELWFRADVDAANRGSECVGFQVVAGGLDRILATGTNAWQQCGGGAGTRTHLIQAGSLKSTKVFGYTLRYYPGMPAKGIADPTKCITQQLTNRTLSAGQLNLVTNVSIDLSGITSERNESADAGLRTAAQITSRTGGDYAYATGCSY